MVVSRVVAHSLLVSIIIRFMDQHDPKVVPIGMHLICRDYIDTLWAIRANKWPTVTLWIYGDVFMTVSSIALWGHSL